MGNSLGWNIPVFTGKTRELAPEIFELKFYAEQFKVLGIPVPEEIVIRAKTEVALRNLKK